MRKIILFFPLWLLVSTLVFGGFFVSHASAQEEIRTFFVESSYDLYGRKTIEATLVREDSHLYFYAEKAWWDGHSAQEQNDLRIALAELGLEFKNRIYPVLTSTFGSEPRPGVDGDERITVLIQRMGHEEGGYFLKGNLYERLILPSSNEREMVYLDSRYVKTPWAKSILAHEFVHLITMQQKDLLRRVTEETWLEEARAEYAPTLLGYDEIYRGSNLEKRVRGFLAKPSVSLTDWFNLAEDYGPVNVFIQYVVDHYGVQTLSDSLQSSQTGIASLNEALRKNGFQEGFAQIFANWAITLLVNDCSLGEKYCYGNKNLQNLRVNPTLYFIPKGQTIFTTYHTTPFWSPHWHRLVGGQGTLALEFTAGDPTKFVVPYVLCDAREKCLVKFLSLDKENKGTITLHNFDQQYSSLTLIPFAQGNGREQFSGGDSFVFSWRVTVEEKSAAEREVGEQTQLMSQLRVRIAELQAQVRQLQVQLALLESRQGGSAVACTRFEKNLFFGMQSEQVRCLQEFLTAQGQDVYPEGLVTGNFFSLTRQAVIRFQEKYALEILEPLGLKRGTGYVGQLTRNKINQLLGSVAVL